MKQVSINAKNQLEFSIFRNKDKLKLILSLLESQFQLESMVENNILINYFPLHNNSYFEKNDEIGTYTIYICFNLKTLI